MIDWYTMFGKKKSVDNTLQWDSNKVSVSQVENGKTKAKAFFVLNGEKFSITLKTCNKLTKEEIESVLDSEMDKVALFTQQYLSHPDEKLKIKPKSNRLEKYYSCNRTKQKESKAIKVDFKNFLSKHKKEHDNVTNSSSIPIELALSYVQQSQNKIANKNFFTLPEEPLLSLDIEEIVIEPVKLKAKKTL